MESLTLRRRCRPERRLVQMPHQSLSAQLCDSSRWEPQTALCALPPLV